MKIKSIRKAVLLLALLTSTSFAAGKNVNVEFRKGHSSAQYSGEIKGYDYDTYTFYAKKGQKVHVSISNEGADTYLFGPGIDDSVDLSRYSPELDSHGKCQPTGTLPVINVNAPLLSVAQEVNDE